MVRFAVFLLTAMGLWLTSAVPARCQTMWWKAACVLYRTEPYTG
jgi:hypothetical protein